MNRNKLPLLLFFMFFIPAPVAGYRIKNITIQSSAAIPASFCVEVRKIIEQTQQNIRELKVGQSSGAVDLWEWDSKLKINGATECRIIKSGWRVGEFFHCILASSTDSAATQKLLITYKDKLLSCLADMGYVDEFADRPRTGNEYSLKAMLPDEDMFGWDATKPAISLKFSSRVIQQKEYIIYLSIDEPHIP